MATGLFTALNVKEDLQHQLQNLPEQEVVEKTTVCLPVIMEHNENWMAVGIKCSTDHWQEWLFESKEAITGDETSDFNPIEVMEWCLDCSEDTNENSM